MTGKELPSPELLHKLLRYEPETGQLFWRERSREFFKTDQNWQWWNNRYAETEAGNIFATGYRVVGIFKRKMLAHRIIWAMQTGQWPTDQIDHINHDRVDNRWVNLRAVTQAENGKNMSMRPSNTSGVCGVYWDKLREKWNAQICHEGKQRNLGLFTDLSAAAEARRAAERDFGFHENHGVCK